jgi:hypothetical protein
MSEEDAPREECLYCHNRLVFGEGACPVCGDTGKAQAKEPEGVAVFTGEFDPEFLAAYP